MKKQKKHNSGGFYWSGKTNITYYWCSKTRKYQVWWDFNINAGVGDDFFKTPKTKDIELYRECIKKNN